MNLFRRYPITIIAAIIGALAGYLYYTNIGCASGTCMITAHPINSTIYGAVLGGLLGDVFNGRLKAKTKINHINE